MSKSKKSSEQLGLFCQHKETVAPWSQWATNDEEQELLDIIDEEAEEDDEDLQIWFDIMEEDGRTMFSIPKTERAERIRELIQERQDQEFFESEMREYWKSDEGFRKVMYKLMDQ